MLSRKSRFSTRLLPAHEFISQNLLFIWGFFLFRNEINKEEETRSERHMKHVRKEAKLKHFSAQQDSLSVICIY